MLRPVSLLPALVAAATLVGLSVPSAEAAPRASSAPAYPLTVSIDTLSSSEIPRSGPIVVTGTVQNRDETPWADIKVYPVVGDTPITTSADLAAAAETEGDVEIGERIIDTDPRTQDTIDELEPGESATFSVTVPHRYLEKTEAGVYWFGVHALGTGPEGRIDGADGRARTFMPYVPRTNKAVDTALVVPVRRQILHTPDGRIADLASWTDSLSPGGPLRSLVDLGAAAGSRTVTWLVDPAVIDAVRRIAAGNPPRSLASTITEEDGGEDGSESPSPSTTASEEPEVPEETEEPEGEEEPELAPDVAEAAEAATAWLERLRAGLENSPILSLPYGDTDVAAAATHDPGAYQRARERAGDVLQPWGYSTTPAVSSPTGYIDLAGIEQVEPDATLLVTDRMFGQKPPGVANVAGHTLGVLSSGAASGGPGPSRRLAPLAVRQRIVSEAALRVLTPGVKPLLVAFPSTWRPSSANGFYTGLDLDWLNLTSVSGATQRSGVDVSAERLTYPEAQMRLELDATSFTAASNLTQAGETLQNLLTENDEVAAEVTGQAMTTTSYFARVRPEMTRASADRSRQWIEAQLASVQVNAPKAVILSSGSGRFAATVSNQLDEPVTVRVEAVADPPLEVSVPSESIQLAAKSKTTVLLNASSSALGVRSVLLRLTDTDNVPLGSSDSLPIRSNRVSNVIWLIVGSGVALLFGAILVRLARRVWSAARS